jgi:low affinity Fe/Cu permease
MEATLTPWQLAGILIAAVVGITTLISVVIAAGIKIGKLVTRDDLDRTSDRLEKKLDDEIAGLQKKVDDEVAGLHKKIGDEVTGLHKKIDDEVTGLHKKIDDEVTGLHKKIDDNNEKVLQAIHNLGIRLENAIMEHTHDEEGVAVFRRHPQMDVVAD